MPSYAGDLNSQQAWELLAGDPEAVLVDVRTRAEWSYVGLPDLTGLGRVGGPVLVEWLSYPDNRPNPAFLDELRRAGVRPDRPVVFLCRSGVRSAAAAATATAAGFDRAYNVSDGFEGPLDPQGHRGSAGGWKASGLPWRQS